MEEKQNYEAMELSKKRMLIEKKQARDTANKLELQKKRAKQYKTMDSAKKPLIKQTSRKIQNYGFSKEIRPIK